ncbi:hypothetical protein LJR230_002208 [Trinickia sp. LjRoot230]|uniref:hypothetical protein n=1 Tax=Trinickia sp. LjRoot230 TaxID=3342288 RepID=UPI003ECD3FB8
MFDDPASARMQIEQLYKASAGNAEDAIAYKTVVDTLIAIGSKDPLPAEKPLLVKQALQDTCGADPRRASAVLARLQGWPSGVQAKFDAFTFARRLAKSGPGFEALMALHAPFTGPQAGPLETAIHDEAMRQSLLLVNEGVERLQSAARREACPISEYEAIEWLDELAQSIAHNPAESSSVPQELRVIVPALVCARMLIANPHAQPHDELRSAYFAARSGLIDSGPGSDLERMQEGLHKLVVYAKRSIRVEHKPLKRLSHWRERVFGSDSQSPLSVLQSPAHAGKLMASPTDEQATEAIDTAIDGIKHLIRLTDREGSPDRAVNARRAIRAAALQYWRAKLAEPGDNVHVLINDRAREQIAAMAANMLGVDVGNPHIRGSRLRQLCRVGPEELQTWATEENLTTTPDARALTAQLRLSEAHQTLKALDAAAIASPPGSSFELSDVGTFVLLDTYQKLTTRHKLILFPHLPPDSPWQPNGAIAPAFRPKRERGASVEMRHSNDDVESELSVQMRANDAWTAEATGFLIWTPLIFQIYGSLRISGGHGKHRSSDVTIRTRSDEAGSARNKLSNLINAMAQRVSANPDIAPPALWRTIASQMFAVPGVSLAWAEEAGNSNTVDSRLGATFRIDPFAPVPNALARWKAGPALEIGGSTSGGNLNRTERNGATRMTETVRRRESDLTASVAPKVWAPSIPIPELPGAPAPIAWFTDEFQGLSFSGAQLPDHPPFDRINASSTWMTATDHTRTRIAMRGDRIEARRCAREVECNHVDALLREIERLRKQSGDASIPPSQELADELGRAQQKGAVYGLRQSMRADVAARIDALRALQVALSPPSPTADLERAKLLKALPDEIDRLMRSPESWTFDGIYLRTTSKPLGEPVGWSWLIKAEAHSYVRVSRTEDIARWQAGAPSLRP